MTVPFHRYLLSNLTSEPIYYTRYMPTNQGLLCCTKFKHHPLGVGVQIAILLYNDPLLGQFMFKFTSRNTSSYLVDTLQSKSNISHFGCSVTIFNLKTQYAAGIISDVPEPENVHNRNVKVQRT